MIEILNSEVVGLEHAIRGMRNPKDSWDRSDSEYIGANWCDYDFVVGDNDHDLMMRLAKGGSVHAKYRRMIVVYADIIAPLYWWKEFDTYKVGTVANSCSTMHTIHKTGITSDLFSLDNEDASLNVLSKNHKRIVDNYIEMLEELRDSCKTGDETWRKLIQLLPEGFNQKRTIMMNYEVLTGIYKSRKNHKLIEWREFCDWIDGLPYSEIITGEQNEVQ